MDENRFDQTLKVVAGYAGRRDALRGLGALGMALIAALGASEVGSAQNGGKKKGDSSGGGQIQAQGNRKQHDKRHRGKRPMAMEHEPERSSGALKVMTRNLYLGASLDPVLQATTSQELVAAATQVFAMVQATDFPERAKALAAEIDAAHPHIVGLQEVTLWRSQTPADFNPNPNARDLEYDFLATLLDELAKRDKSYEAVATVQNADAEVPRATPNGLQDIRYTDRDSILARTDLPEHNFRISNAQSANFEAILEFPNPVLGTVPIPRGWTAVDVSLEDRTVRVVNTHLEPLHPGIQVAQGNELLTGPLDTSLPIVLLGDLNSAADGTPGATNTPTYRNLLAASFEDAWTAARSERPGLTWGHAEDLRNPTPDLTVRIDFILTRGGIDVSSANLVGDEPEDRTASGLWPSDHAGVWAVLHLKTS